MELSKIVKNLETHVNSLIPNHSFSEVYRYGTLPPGKVFRPQLVCSVYKDFLGLENFDFLNNHKNSINFLASSVEVHHAYTLLHDDLPCMDDDDQRRGKPSAHIKFNEWKALLAGDGLLSASFALLGKYKGTNLSLVLRLYSWALGPKGLIQGQVLDLSEEMTLSFENLLRTHEYKTARLIQVSMLLGLWCAMDEKGSKSYYQESKNIFRLGHSIGIVFQLLDDLTELVDEKLTDHEVKVNPWINSFNENCYQTILKELSSIEKMLNSGKLNSTREVLSNYFKKIESMIIKDRTNIESHTKKDLLPVISLLQSINT
ncbi:polyprenyl synthetase family protein [Halobacteriovorax sp. HLS]|uniref:polyprenyl synthetase family protein n=1 Tax=Halobacteriovorax sp. HLS TaxID=2234000 RepID=UPI000FD922B7|nr:polyprenyl synthetase family protein [Halobacteriovorax sp. HLS]